MICGVNREASHFMSVFSQLFVAGHTVDVDDVNNRVLRTHPDLIMNQPHHACLYREENYVKILRKMLAE